eukprot:m.105900 g.105900  ORF g.105900 m.105900 type:complete len:129 (+) comp15294_c0_seq12:3-389(+)
MGCLYWLTISMAVPMVLSWHSVTYYPEQVGEPTGVNYDSPYAACNVSGTVRGYSANQESYLVAQGSTANNWLSTPQAINLTRGSALDTCGSWLNAVVYDEAAGWLVVSHLVCSLYTCISTFTPVISFG